MSRAKAVQDQQPSGQYMTPAWCIEALALGNPLFSTLDKSLPWLEPCVGTGNFVRHLPKDIRWHLVELDPKFLPDIFEVCGSPDLHVEQLTCPQNFLTMDFGTQRYGAVVTNPPYTLAREFIEKGLTLSDNVIMLLRINFLGSLKRMGFIEETKPDVGMLYPRPRFFNGGSDATEYGFFHFYPGADGHYYVLPPGPNKRGLK